MQISKSFSVLALGLFLPAALFAQATSSASADVDYGEMYVVQKREPVISPWHAGVGYGYGFSNPYFSVHGAQLQLARSVGEFATIGIEPSYFMTSDKGLASSLEQQLAVQNIRTETFKPKYSVALMTGLVPLSGMLNWFSTKPLNFDLNVGLGFAYSKYAAVSSWLPGVRLKVSPQVMLTSAFGVSAGIESSFDRFQDGDWQNRVDVVSGVFTRF